VIRGQSGNHYLIGISEENVRRLKAGDPIVFKLNEFGLTGPDITIMICYGETEEKLALELKDVMGPQTKVTDYRANRKSNK